MAKGFTEREKMIINEKLLDAAEECWDKYGLKKTTVDELVKKAGISKGAFYLFYQSKELLFFKVLERIDYRIKNSMLETLKASKDNPKQTFINAIYNMFLEIQKNPWIVNLQDGDYDLLVKKLPEDEVANHLLKDQIEISSILKYFKVDCDSGFVSSALKTIFFTILHKKEIGCEHFDKTIRFLIESLANTIFDGGKGNEINI